MVKATSSVQDRKQRETDLRRKEVIKAVRKLIKVGGARAITLRKVAEHAGFSTTVVYALFKDKATLITQAMDSDLLDLAKAMRGATEPGLSPAENIKRAGRAYVSYGMRHPDQYALVFLERRPHAPIESAMIEHGNQSQDPYAFGRQLFSELAESGLVRADRLDAMGQIFWEGIHGMTSLRLVFGDKEMWFEHDAFAGHMDALMDVLMTGILHRFRP